MALSEVHSQAHAGRPRDFLATLCSQLLTELKEEMDEHVRMKEKDLSDEGVLPDDARDTASRNPLEVRWPGIKTSGQAERRSGQVGLRQLLQRDGCQRCLGKSL